MQIQWCQCWHWSHWIQCVACGWWQAFISQAVWGEVSSCEAVVAPVIIDEFNHVSLKVVAYHTYQFAFSLVPLPLLSASLFHLYFAVSLVPLFAFPLLSVASLPLSSSFSCLCSASWMQSSLVRTRALFTYVAFFFVPVELEGGGSNPEMMRACSIPSQSSVGWQHCCSFLMVAARWIAIVHIAGHAGQGDNIPLQAASGCVGLLLMWRWYCWAEERVCGLRSLCSEHGLVVCLAGCCNACALPLLANLQSGVMLSGLSVGVYRKAQKSRW